MKDRSEILIKIKSIVNTFITDADVLLFGSQARNEANSNSDYDILVITNKTLTLKERLFYKTIIRKELLKHGVLTDVLIQTKKDVEAKRNISGHIIKTIMNNFVLL
ncbi:MAG TPA: nucleotidyltransferase domain-containing protein [Bacteroidales bacterium]|mgnify:CR=1 FL=1|nr:nucleotidyltransferase domain-containing protein [Bacteroidales bacterium]